MSKRVYELLQTFALELMLALMFFIGVYFGMGISGGLG